jgi:S-adenosylmethionine:tRNA-ribosyltransferase-isomerase (queuine synthetase)
LLSYTSRRFGTQSVEVEDLSKHKMDSEELKITQAACDIVNDAN